MSTGGGEVSTEQDILIVDTSLSAPLFQSADFGICFPENVLAAVSVKTACARGEIINAVAGLRSVQAMCNSPWTGVFFFDDETTCPKPATLYEAIRDAIQENQPLTKPIGTMTAHLGPSLFATMKSLSFAVDYDEMTTRIRGFACPEYAVGVFVSQLLSHIESRRAGAGSRLARILDRMTATPLEPPDWVFPTTSTSK